MFIPNNRRPSAEILSENLKYFRERANLSREDFAMRANLATGTVHRIETLACQTTLATVDKCANVLGIPTSYLLEERN